jgi:hypothetical protein
MNLAALGAILAAKTARFLQMVKCISAFSSLIMLKVGSKGLILTIYLLLKDNENENENERRGNGAMKNEKKKEANQPKENSVIY